MIRKASKEDIKELQKVYDEARERMYESGNTVQWEPEYPQEYIILKDIERGFLHVMEEDGEIVAAFSILTGKEPNYDTIFEGSWPEGDYEYVTIHRVAGKKKAHHVLKQSIYHLRFQFFSHGEQGSCQVPSSDGRECGVM